MNHNGRHMGNKETLNHALWLNNEKLFTLAVIPSRLTAEPPFEKQFFNWEVEKDFRPSRRNVTRQSSAVAVAQSINLLVTHAANRQHGSRLITSSPRRAGVDLLIKKLPHKFSYRFAAENSKTPIDSSLLIDTRLVCSFFCVTH